VTARRWLAAALVALACVTASARAAEPWPARPVRIVVTYPPGGTSDLIARISAQILTEKLGKPFVVENRAGAGGNIGTDAVAKSPPDGYTLLQGTFGPITTAVALYPKLPYAPARDLVPIVVVADVPNLLLVHPSVPARTVAELVELAKARPGKLNMAVSSLGGTPHLLTEMFQQKAGIRFTSIPYKGTAPALTDVVAGQVEVDFDALPAVLPFVKADRLRPLAIAGKSRVPQLPDVPTMAEAGYPDVEISAWHGLLAPAGTPPEVIAKWNAGVTKILSAPDMRERLASQGAEAAPDTPAQFAAFIDGELVKYAKIVKASGAKVD